MLFRPKGRVSFTTDLHSHLIPGVDDGVKTVQEALEVIKALASLGYRELITTPHISAAYYPNSVAFLRERHHALLEAIEVEKLEVTVRLGAEYMVDDHLLETLKKGEKLLSWHGYVLIETSFHSFPWITDQVIYEIQTQGLVPVLAHPERYPYFMENLNGLLALVDKGVKLQLTAGSLVGQYGDQVKKFAHKLLKNNLIDFVGSDIHRMSHLSTFTEGLSASALRKVPLERFLNQKLPK